MTKEIGPREKALREQREAKFEKNKAFGFKPSHDTLKALGAKIETASAKRGKPRKAKK